MKPYKIERGPLKKKYGSPEKRMRRVAYNLKAVADILIECANIIETEEDCRKVLKN